jgi:hypothetical protein
MSAIHLRAIMKIDQTRLGTIVLSVITIATVLALSLALHPGRDIAPESVTGRQAALDEERRLLADRELDQAKQHFMLALKYHARFRAGADLRNIEVGKTYHDDTSFGICGQMRLPNADGTKDRYVGFVGIDDLQGRPIFIFEDDDALRMTWETVARNIGCATK